MADGVTCIRCLGRVDEGAFNMKARLHAKLHPNAPFYPPRVCSECWLLAVHELCGDESVDVEEAEGFEPPVH